MLCYHTAVQLKEVHGNGFQSEIEDQINQIAKFLKQEYRKVTGDNISLTPEGEVDILVQKHWLSSILDPGPHDV